MTLEATQTADALEHPAPRPPPRNRMVVAVLALVGLLIAFYLSAHVLGLVPLVCGVSDCETVQSSQWSMVGPIPTPLIGLGGYAAVLALAVLGLQPRFQDARSLGLAMLALATIGVAFSGFLTYQEAAVIHAWCVWCVTSASVMTLIFLASLPELARGEDA